MRISENILATMKKTFGKMLPNSHVLKRNKDFLIKINLAPIIGRRDAAYDMACSLSSSDIFSLGLEQQFKVCNYLCELMEGCIEDTLAVIHILSSPDTVSREQKFLNFQQNIYNFLKVWEHLIISQNYTLLNAQDSHSLYLSNDDDNKVAWDEDMLNEFEVSLVNRINAIFAEASHKILRYRSYMTKSFSKSYFERYNKSFSEYSKNYKKYYTIKDLK